MNETLRRKLPCVHKSWDETQLWRLVQERTRQGDQARQLLNGIMPKIEAVLAKGGTAPLDFTLHDEEHAFRVAGRMWELLPDDVSLQMSSLEFSLLLLSAYLHDIGMTPTRPKVDSHYKYILTKEDNLLTEEEAHDLQRWLDEAQGGLDLPIPEGVTAASDLVKAEELLAYYCRHRHNDWSEAWIRKNLIEEDNGLYPGWIEDLVTLCRSHHEGIEALQQPRFDARLQRSGEFVNLRYLAAVLRVADVMEFDPERTPDVIIKHRAIAPKSRVFWLKDRFTFVIDRKQPAFRLDATTPDAKTHRAVRETVDAVNRELMVCNSLETSGHFLRGSTRDDRCRWPWPATVNATITERAASFVYIEGAFRPEPQHVLKLLGGVELYRDPLVAVRELLQNALDAVKEQIARERLRQRDPGDLSWERKFGEVHKVTLSLVEGSDGIWLACNDDGIGMTRDIIERHLLVSGAPPSPEVHQIERAANSHGFSLERSAQFGIGVLSYFMLADHMIINTRRSDLAGGDPDSCGWEFETEGLAGFGELRPIRRSDYGSEVRLRIRPQAVEAVRASLTKYVRNILIYAPCHVEVITSGPAPEFAAGPGWCRTPDRIRAILTGRVVPHRSPPPTNDRLESLEAARLAQDERARWDQARRKASRCLRWPQPTGGQLPHNLGRFRLHLPYFDLGGEPSLAFLDLQDGQGRFLSLDQYGDHVHGSLPGGNVLHSWRGFRIKPQNLPESFPVAPIFLEIDWRQDADLGVDRSVLRFNDTACSAFRELYEMSLREAVRAVEKIVSSRYLNNDHSILDQIESSQLREPRNRIYLYHAQQVGESEFRWQKIAFPALGVRRWAGAPPLPDLTWCGSVVEQVVPLRLRPPDRRVSPFAGLAADRLVVYDMHHQHLVKVHPLWESSPTRRPVVDKHLTRCTAFPPEWQHVAAFNTEFGSYGNIDHPITKFVRSYAINWVRAHCCQGDPRGVVSELRNDQNIMAAWLMENIFQEQAFWDGIRDKLPGLWTALLQMLRENGSLPVVAGSSVHTISLTEGGRQIEWNPLPVPKDEEWLVRRIAGSKDGGGKPEAGEGA